MGEPSFGGEGEPGANRKQVPQAPTDLVDAEAMRVAPDHVQEGVFSLLVLLAVRGKKQACARVPVGWKERRGPVVESRGPSRRRCLAAWNEGARGGQPRRRGGRPLLSGERPPAPVGTA